MSVGTRPNLQPSDGRRVGEKSRINVPVGRALSLRCSRRHFDRQLGRKNQQTSTTGTWSGRGGRNRNPAMSDRRWKRAGAQLHCKRTTMYREIQKGTERLHPLRHYAAAACEAANSIGDSRHATRAKYEVTRALNRLPSGSKPSRGISASGSYAGDGGVELLQLKRNKTSPLEARALRVCTSQI